MNNKFIGVQLGDILKNCTSLNEIERAGNSILDIKKDSFPNSAITAQRAQAVYDWIMSLSRANLTEDERNKKLVKFCFELAPDPVKGSIIELLEKNGCPYNILYHDSLDEFYQRAYHEEIHKHSKKLFVQGNYFHAVFEASKAYNNMVKEKSVSDKDGEALMMNVFSPNGVLKLNTGQTESERNVQEGIKFLSSGLMRAVRNPTAHEPAVNWPINKQDCLDLLSMISFLFRKLDTSITFPI